MSQLDISDYGVSGRGGPDPPLTVEEATALFERWRIDETLMLRQAILRRAYAHGTIHADDLRDLPVTKANGIGSSFNVLQRAGFITPRRHRASTFPATHGRRSYEYALTAKGERLAALL